MTRAAKLNTLRLPAPELTSCRIESIRMVESSVSSCRRDWDRLRTLGEVQVMLDFVAQSLREGLLEDAAERSELILGEFVRSLTGKRVQVTFEKQRGSPKLDASCRPTDEAGWHYSRAKNEWKS